MSSHALSDSEYQFVTSLQSLLESSGVSMQDLIHASSRSLQAENATVTYSSFDTGNTAWMMTSCALVLMMTIPGLALYYGGMTRTKNILAMLMQIFSITCLITFLWLCFGYSLAFAPVAADEMRHSLGGNGNDVQVNPFLGDSSRFWLVGTTIESFHFNAPTIPESVFIFYQLTFAIITAALMCGSFADRMKYGSMLLFISIWHICVYCPIAHWVWHPNGFLFKTGALDFAGGNVVHISSGMSGLATVMVIGNRKGFGKERFEAHNTLYTVVGCSMIWVGWFGFNGGSEVASDGKAGMACLVTQISTSMAALTWMLTDWYVSGKPSVLGMINGAIAGLVAITPASGYVDPTGGFFIGLFAGPVCYFGALLKHMAGYDDALDAFGVHAVGGIYGGLMTAFFASQAVCPACATNGILYQTGHGYTERARLLGIQVYSIVVTLGWSFFMTYFICRVLDSTIGIRVSDKEEDEGLDSSIHGESVDGTVESEKIMLGDKVADYDHDSAVKC
jgi:Amt family ammonium transporter